VVLNRQQLGSIREEFQVLEGILARGGIGEENSGFEIFIFLLL